MKANFINQFFKILFSKVFSTLIKNEVEKKVGNITIEVTSHGEALKKLLATVSKMEKTLTPEKAKQILDPNLFEFPSRGLKIRVENYGNERDKKCFHISKPCWVKDCPVMDKIFPFNPKNCGFEKGSEEVFLRRMFSSYVVAQIYSHSAFKITIIKPGSLTWEEVTPMIVETIASTFPEINNNN